MCGNMKIYLEIYCLGCNMQLNCSIASLFLIHSTRLALKLHIPSSGDNNTDSATRSQCLHSLITNGITDKEAYLSKTIG